MTSEAQSAGAWSAGGAASTIRTGALGGLLGGAFTWAYEVVVWVGLQHTMTLPQIPANGTGLVFGPEAKEAMGWPASALLGAAIHFGFAIAWGVLFAFIWPYFRRRGYEATLVALFYAVAAWMVMHGAIVIAGHPHPNYSDPSVVISGFMSHFFFTVPMALYIKRRLGRDS